MTLLGVSGKTVKRLVRLPTSHSLRRLQPKPASGGRPTIPVWRSHAARSGSGPYADARTRPSRSTRAVRDGTLPQSATVNANQKERKNHGPLPVRSLTGEAIYLLHGKLHVFSAVTARVEMAYLMI